MTLSRTWRSCLLVLLCSASLAAAACSGEDGSEEVAETPDTEAVAATEVPVEGGTLYEATSEESDSLKREAPARISAEEETSEEATIDDDEKVGFNRVSIEDILEEAEHRRAMVVERITAHVIAREWGVDDDNILRGPEGFMVDLSACPDDWSDTEGITDTEIRIGQIGPQSGRLAAYDDARTGWVTYLDHINAQGGIAGRKVVLHSRDDGYEATKTVEFVDDLIRDGSVFSIHTMGSPNTLAVYDTLNDECIPQPFVWTGHPAWGDPEIHPWTTGGIMSYSTEAVLWGDWIRKNLADDLPVVVAGLVMDGGFGPVYESGFREYAEKHPDAVREFVFQRHVPAATTIANEIATLAASDPDVFISMTAGNACLLAIEEVAASSLKEELSAAFTSSICKAPASWVAPAGDAGHGWLVVGGGVKDITDPALIGSDAFVGLVIERLGADGLDPAISMFGNGYLLAYPYVEALRIAAELPGGLSRTNFILAVRAIDIRHPMYLDGITFAMNGNADAFPVEGTDISQYDSSSHSWIVANTIDVNGGTPTCAWDRDTGACR